jgi:glycosyltransferase involved in cell wall biosynthesis
MSASEKKRILIIASYPNSIIRFRGKLIDALIDRGVEVHVAAPDLKPHHLIRTSLEKKGVSVHNIYLKRTGMNPLLDVCSLVSIVKVIREYKFSTVLSYTVKPVIYGSIAATIAGVPNRLALITGLGYAFTDGIENKRSFLQLVLRKLYSIALARVDVTFFQNPDDEKLFRSSKILKEHSKTIVLNGSGVDLEEFQVAPLQSKPKFLFIGRFLGDKGVREYVEAAKRIRVKNNMITFGLVGWIDDNPDSVQQNELELWKSSGDILYIGRLEDVRQAISESSVFVLPSYREGTPRTVLEAMAMGRPIITTNVPGCKETVIDGRNGFLISKQSVDDIVIAMKRFIDDPQLIKQMGQRSREIAEMKYDVRKVNKIMMQEMEILF